MPNALYIFFPDPLAVQLASIRMPVNWLSAYRMVRAVNGPKMIINAVNRAVLVHAVAIAAVPLRRIVLEDHTAPQQSLAMAMGQHRT